MLRKMAEPASHRGRENVLCREKQGVGLASLGFSELGAPWESQPLVGRRGDLVLVADARVDNRGDLERLLIAGGYLEERSPTDADVILAAYMRWGEECPRHIIGDFAFAVWDARLGRLFAARDPMAMRSLYYRAEPRRLLFATEVKQILAVPGVPERIFEPAVGAHLAACDLLPEWTFHEGISSLPPAHALTADAAGCRTWRYWDIDPEQRIEYAGEAEYAERFLELFKESVRCRLRGANPAGLLLSGGIDSGNIASTAGWLLNEEDREYAGLRAYSWAFEELAQCDERHISDDIAAHYGLPVTHVPAEEAWPLKDFPAVGGPDRDDPYAGGFQTLMESALAAARDEGMGTMLTGHRGDLAAGMWIFDYLGLLRSGRLRQLWRELQSHERLNGVPLRAAAGIYLLDPLKQSLWPPGRVDWLRRPLGEVARRLRGGPRPAPPYPGWLPEDFARRAGVEELARRDIPSPELGDYARNERYRAVFNPLHMRVAGHSDRLMSRYGMAHSDPWSDRRLIEFVLAVPQNEINRAGENKRLARRSMAGIMPEKARRAAGKVSPEPLFHRALKDWSRETVLDLITDSEAAARGYVSERELADYYESFCQGRVNDSRFWHALTLEMWLRRYW